MGGVRYGNDMLSTHPGCGALQHIARGLVIRGFRGGWAMGKMEAM